MSVNFFLHVVTAKGLAYLLKNHNSAEMREAVRHELARRNANGSALAGVKPVKRREPDGYERDQ